MSQVVETAVATPAEDPQIFGQPRGIATLFLTEMWERFSFYGARAMLVPFMAATLATGGLGISDKNANAAYGLYLAGSYLTGILGGWIADRLIGAQRAVIAGGVFIMVGNAMLTAGNPRIFFLGLLVTMLGVGLLKPNVSNIVAKLYPEGGARRDAGFSFFYMGINIGSAGGSLLVPWCAYHFGWHAGFGLPAVGMAFGLVQFLATHRYLKGHGAGLVTADNRGSWTPIIVIAAVIALFAGLALSGTISLDPSQVGGAFTWVFSVLALGYFGYLYWFAGLDADARKRVLVILALFIGSVMFWAGFEQMGASFNLFAYRYTDLNVFGLNIPPGMLQGANPLFIIIFAPTLAVVWLSLNRRNRDPSAPVKFALGMLLMGAGFLIMYFASLRVMSGIKVLPTWLIVTYLCHSLGELCLSPVGLSSMTKLAPPRFVGQVMGLWFVSLAIGDNLAGQLAGEYDSTHLESLPGLFMKVFLWGAISGVVMLLFAPLLKRLTGGAR